MLDLKQLKLEKQRQHITYQCLEEMTGVSKTDICKICNNQCITVNLDKVDKIRAALGMKREALLQKESVPLATNEVMKGQITI